MSITSSPENTEQATVNFTLKVWDYGLRTKFEVKTWLANNYLFTHNSGLVDITQETIRIKKEEDCHE